MDIEEPTSPVILTTSQLLTTGVDAPTCKNIVLVRVINSMTQFKQIIGRGTRVREDAGKSYSSIFLITPGRRHGFLQILILTVILFSSLTTTTHR